MPQPIQYFARKVYGQIKLYPANAAARTLADIAKTTTLAQDVLVRAELLGLTLQRVDDPEACRADPGHTQGALVLA